MTQEQRPETLCRDSLRFSIRNTETKQTSFFALGDYTIYAQKKQERNLFINTKKTFNQQWKHKTKKQMGD